MTTGHRSDHKESISQRKSSIMISKRANYFQISSSKTNYEFSLGNGALCFECFDLEVKMLIRHDVRGAVYPPRGRISHGGIQSFVSRTLSVTADHVTGEA
jgi:hypothetical protein